MSDITIISHERIHYINQRKHNFNTFDAVKIGMIKAFTEFVGILSHEYSVLTLQQTHTKIVQGDFRLQN